MSHSFLPPSGASIWEVCHAWPLFNMLFPDGDTEASADGIAAHDEAAASLRSYQQVGDIVIAADHGVRLYVTHVLNVLQKFGGLQALHVEDQLPIIDIHPDCFGTPDGWAYDEKAQTVHVFEFKFGYVPVEVYENRQMIAYLTGVLRKLELSDLNVKVVFHLVQPRATHRAGRVRVWEFYAHNIRHIVNALHYSAGVIMGDQDKVATPGAHCLYCPGRHTCDAAQSFAAAATAFASGFQVAELTPDQAGRELADLTAASVAIKARLTGLEAQVDSMLRAGASVPGWQLETTETRRNWTQPPEMVYAMGDMIGIDLRVTKPCTPTQALDVGIDGAVIDAYSSRSTAQKLTQVNPAQLRHLFDGE